MRGAGVQYVGSVGRVERARLMGKACALIQPTVFMEPFGGNVVEAAMCGTPAITTDYAAFSETVRHGVTGYRCHTLEQFVWAARAVRDLDSAEIRRIAVANYSMDRVALMYQKYFEMLSGLWGQGWPELKSRTKLDWLQKT
jgi:glycosyltransferase involved in cell wall biosynthesis